MADRWVIPLREVMSGISPRAPLNQNMPTAYLLNDFRVSEAGLQKIIFSGIAAAQTATPEYGRLVLENGYRLLNGVTHVANFDGQWLWRLLSGSMVFDGATVAMPSVGFFGYNGSLVIPNVPGDGKFLLTAPGRLPLSPWVEGLTTGISTTIDYAAALPVGAMAFSLEDSVDVRLAHRHGSGLLVYGDQSVSVFLLAEVIAQTRLPIPGILAGRAAAGDGEWAYCVGQDKNLWGIENGKAQNLGFGYLWQNATRAFLSFVRETGDLFIVLDEGEAGALVNPRGFLYNKGLSELSTGILDAIFDPAQGIVGLTEDGDIVRISGVNDGLGPDYDWALWDTGTEIVVPTRTPDLSTTFTDLGTGLIKTISGVEAVMTPCWPIYVRVSSIEPGSATIGTDDVAVTAVHPTGELSVAGYKFRMDFWFEYGSEFFITELRLHIQAEDLRGIYAVAQNPSIANSRDLALRESWTR